MTIFEQVMNIEILLFLAGLEPAVHLLHALQFQKLGYSLNGNLVSSVT